MMLPVAAAANWQFRCAVRNEGGTDQREAEKYQQQRCERAPHFLSDTRFKEFRRPHFALLVKRANCCPWHLLAMKQPAQDWERAISAILSLDLVRKRKIPTNSPGRTIFALLTGVYKRSCTSTMRQIDACSLRCVVIERNGRHQPRKTTAG
jgi:hypothetical protein